MQHKILIFFFFFLKGKKWKLQLNDCALTTCQDSEQLFAPAVLSCQCYLWLCRQAARCSSSSSAHLTCGSPVCPANSGVTIDRARTGSAGTSVRPPGLSAKSPQKKNSVLLPNRQFGKGKCIKGSATPAWFIEMCLPPSLRTQRAPANNLVSLPVAATRGLFTGSPGGNEGSPDKQSYDTALMPGPNFSSFSPSCPPGCLSRLSLLPPLGRGLCRHGNLSLHTRGTRRLPLLFMRRRDPLCQPSPGGVCRTLLPFLSLSASGG